MKKILAVAAGLVAMAAIGSAAPTCASLVPPSSSTAVNVTSSALGMGCTADGLLFYNFFVSNASTGTGTAEIDLDGVSISGNDVILNFNPNLGSNTIGGGITDLHFTFQVMALTGSLTGADADTGGQNAGVNETICSVATSFTTSCAPDTNVLFKALVLSNQSGTCQGSNTPVSPVSICNFGAGVTNAWVFKDISIGSSASSDLTSFNESFYTTSSVPEPMTLSMMGVGLLGLGLISRRGKKS